MPRSTMAMEVAVLPTPGVTLMILAAGAVVSAAVGRGGAGLSEVVRGVVSAVPGRGRRRRRRRRRRKESSGDVRIVVRAVLPAKNRKF